jgi:hypothetical protein
MFMDYMSRELHQKLHQDLLFGSRLGFGCFSVSFISSFITIINSLLTNTYKITKQIRNPLLMIGHLKLLLLVMLNQFVKKKFHQLVMDTPYSFYLVIICACINALIAALICSGNSGQAFIIAVRSGSVIEFGASSAPDFAPPLAKNRVSDPANGVGSIPTRPIILYYS